MKPTRATMERVRILNFFIGLLLMIWLVFVWLSLVQPIKKMGKTLLYLA
jgi:hypothetical protein